MPRLIGMLSDLRAIGRLPEDICNAFCVVTDEVVNNLLTHALQGSPDFEIGFTVQVYPDRIELEISDDGPSFKADKPFHDAKDALIARFEREYLEDLVKRADGNLSQAARVAGLERKFLYKLLERAGLRQRDGDKPDADD